jgi:hypothetical protein
MTEDGQKNMQAKKTTALRPPLFHYYSITATVSLLLWLQRLLLWCCHSFFNLSVCNPLITTSGVFQRGNLSQKLNRLLLHTPRNIS